jgi:hypothetical protein
MLYLVLQSVSVCMLSTLFSSVRKCFQKCCRKSSGLVMLLRSFGAAASSPSFHCLAPTVPACPGRRPPPSDALLVREWAVWCLWCGVSSLALSLHPWTAWLCSLHAASFTRLTLCSFVSNSFTLYLETCLTVSCCSLQCAPETTRGLQMMTKSRPNADPEIILRDFYFYILPCKRYWELCLKKLLYIAKQYCLLLLWI